MQHSKRSGVVNHIARCATGIEFALRDAQCKKPQQGTCISVTRQATLHFIIWPAERGFAVLLRHHGLQGRRRRRVGVASRRLCSHPTGLPNARHDDATNVGGFGRATGSRAPPSAPSSGPRTGSWATGSPSTAAPSPSSRPSTNSATSPAGGRPGGPRRSASTSAGSAGSRASTGRRSRFPFPLSHLPLRWAGTGVGELR